MVRAFSMSAAATDSSGSSFARTGALDRLFRTTHIVRDCRGDILRQLLVFTVVTWVPLDAIQLVEWLISGRVEPVFRDISLHVRFLVAAPLLFFAESTLYQRCTTAMDLLIDRVGAVQVHRIALLGRRLRAAPFEAGLLLLALFLSRLAPRGVEMGSGAVRLWYEFVALPLVTFLLLRVVWFWIVWCILLGWFARLDLQANALHPDRSGGLRFLGLPSNGFTVVLAAMSCVVSGAWASQALSGARSLSIEGAAVPFAVFLATALVVTVAPLLPFMPQLYRARLEGLRRYTGFADAYTRRFQRRWLRGPEDDSLLGSPDIQSLADLASGQETAQGMWIVPFGTQTLAAVAAAIAVPLLPLALLKVPFREVLQKLVGHILGG
jgi:hypothetical protein